MQIAIIASLFTIGFMAGDLLFGVLKAIKTKTLNSSIFREGIWHKTGFLGLILLAFGIQTTFYCIEPTFSFPAVETICGLICICEIISIYENLCELNPQLKEKEFSQIFASIESKENQGK